MAHLDKHIPLHCTLSGAWTSSRHSKAPWLRLKWGKKYGTGHLSVSFEGPVEHIKNKVQCQKHTSEKFICISVQWPLERRLMDMSVVWSYLFQCFMPIEDFSIWWLMWKGNGMNCTHFFKWFLRFMTKGQRDYIHVFLQGTGNWGQVLWVNLPNPHILWA